MCGIADQKRPSAPPGRQSRDIERVGDHDVLGRVDKARDRIMPAGVEMTQTLLQLPLVHGAKGRSVRTVRRLSAPPHRALRRIGAAESVAEEAASLTERCHDVRTDTGIFQQRPRRETAKA